MSVPPHQRGGRIVRSVADDLAYAARPQSPSPAAPARMLDAVAAAEAPILDRLDGVRFVRADHLQWRPGVFAGVEFKILRADHEAGRVTLLTRLAPGTIYPHHQHDDFEELFLLDGDVVVNGVPMIRATTAAPPPAASTTASAPSGGCTFIVATSTRDALFA